MLQQKNLNKLFVIPFCNFKQVDVFDLETLALPLYILFTTLPSLKIMENLDNRFTSLVDFKW